MPAPLVVAGAALAAKGAGGAVLEGVASGIAGAVAGQAAKKLLGGAAAAAFPPLAPVVAVAGAGLAVYQIGKFLFGSDDK